MEMEPIAGMTMKEVMLRTKEHFEMGLDMVKENGHLIIPNIQEVTLKI